MMLSGALELACATAQHCLSCICFALRCPKICLFVTDNAGEEAILTSQLLQGEIATSPIVPLQEIYGYATSYRF